jgi:hypothetical protein
MVVQTVVESLPDMANIVLLLLIVMFVFSIVGLELFATKVPDHFGSLSYAMFSLFVCMTQDGWADMYQVWLCFSFLFLVVGVAITLLHPFLFFFISK